MRQSVGLGRVAGIPVGVHWTVAVILVIIAEILGASVLPAALPHQPAVVYWAAALVFAGSLLAHELAHSLVAQRNGCGCARSRCGCLAGWPNWLASRPTRSPTCGSYWTGQLPAFRRQPCSAAWRSPSATAEGRLWRSPQRSGWR